MSRLEVDAWLQAIAAAAGQGDWQRLAQLDQALRQRLAEPGLALDDGQRQALAEAYRAALGRSQAELDGLRHRLSSMGQQREGQMAYAQFSEWEQA
ncbi:hypothetical protein [Chromobacterium sphagni]|uniref:PH domain-containing protein n=1 Tax=Chromobacterium sphagni TaxID=1903179 RepID=A0A1S1WVW3_9NEIS|nr:hypothetical protein [Chromobacterium sphagni]OHX11454.1 hypothetical protein BI347_17435 [Chromobacterium sphagni]OHX20928.1 hypothetical protein BI344_13305 [Chromobacterium sphagni]